MKRKSRGIPIGLKASCALFGMAVLGVSALTVFGPPKLSRSDPAEIKATIEEARLERAVRASALEKARRAVPPGAPVEPDWDFKALLDTCDHPHFFALFTLVKSYVSNPGDISEGDLATIRDIVAKLDSGCRDSPFYFPIDLDKQSKQELLEQLGPFLGRAKVFTDIEAGLDRGLCDGIVDAYTNPKNSELTVISALFAGRAVYQLESGDIRRALDTCLRGYTLAGLLGKWPHSLGYSERYVAEKALDTALWHIVDAAPPDPALQAPILEALDRRKATDELARGFRFHAAYIEEGLVVQDYVLPKAASVGFAVAGRGALDRAKQMIGLLGSPPYRVQDELASIRQRKFAGYWANQFADFATSSYKLHAREAMMGDMARIAFALKAYAREHGAYPAKLDQLIPFPLAEIPTDPLVGCPVVYEAADHSFALSAPAAGEIWPETYWQACK